MVSIASAWRSAASSEKTGSRSWWLPAALRWPTGSRRRRPRPASPRDQSKWERTASIISSVVLAVGRRDEQALELRRGDEDAAFEGLKSAQPSCRRQSVGEGAATSRRRRGEHRSDAHAAEGPGPRRARQTDTRAPRTRRDRGASQHAEPGGGRDGRTASRPGRRRRRGQVLHHVPLSHRTQPATATADDLSQHRAGPADGELVRAGGESR